MNVAFVNENMMGHASYLLPFVNELRANPDLGVNPQVLHATPLPEPLARRTNFSIRGLRRWGLDFHNARWRMGVSRYVRDELRRAQAAGPLDAVVVNTQSVALHLHELAAEIPVFVCLDATFEQLSNSKWFAPNRGTRLFLPLTARSLRQRERLVLQRAHRLLAWSEPVRQSLLQDYSLPAGKISLLPPSVDLRRRTVVPRCNSRPQILFVGGDFRRKGGCILLECYRRWFRDKCDLHLVTHSPIEPEPGVHVHRGVQSYSDAWYERWQQADVFVFPSMLETFGIVLLEALAFGVPVISSFAGAAPYVLAGGEAGWLLKDDEPETMARALREVLDSPAAARERAARGSKLVERNFNLERNTAHLANWIRDAVQCRPSLCQVC